MLCSFSSSGNGSPCSFTLSFIPGSIRSRPFILPGLGKLTYETEDLAEPQTHSWPWAVPFPSLGLSFPTCKNKGIGLNSLVLPALTSLTIQLISSPF